MKAMKTFLDTRLELQHQEMKKKVENILKTYFGSLDLHFILINTAVTIFPRDLTFAYNSNLIRKEL